MFLFGGHGLQGNKIPDISLEDFEVENKRDSSQENIEDTTVI